MFEICANTIIISTMIHLNCLTFQKIPNVPLADEAERDHGTKEN